MSLYYLIFSNTPLTLNQVIVMSSGGPNNYACFTAGTMIATPTGEMPVESLSAGDMVATAAGTARPIRWIGRARVRDIRPGSRTYVGRPVVIGKNALGGGLPTRDLRVSPQHGIAIDGVLVPAISLVNGVSITRDDACDTVDYIHIELETHDLILSEGVASETFVDHNSRASFDNAAEYRALFGTSAAPVADVAPRIEQGYILAAIRDRLAAIAGIERPAHPTPGPLHSDIEAIHAGVLHGWVIDLDHPNRPVELEILVHGESVGRALANRYRYDLDQPALAGGHCSFTFDLPPSTPSLASVEVRRVSDGSILLAPVLGFGDARAAFTTDADVHLIVNGARLDPTQCDASSWVFDVPTGAVGVKLMSRATVPALSGLNTDKRRLGICIDRLVIIDGGITMTMDPGHPALGAGMHAPEGPQTGRWTNGLCKLPDLIFAGYGSDTTLRLTVHGTTIARFLDADSQARAESRIAA